MIDRYNTGTKFKITVQYIWNDNPNNDFTLKAYSKFDNVNILDSNGKTSIVHYNGSSLSGFTDY